jgi:parallel beta-helix repeat protein
VTEYYLNVDTFYGTLRIAVSGTAGSPVTIGSYGTGEKPVITGFKTVTGWKNEGNGIYSASLSSESQTNMVLIDGKQYAMGRWPDSGYRFYNSASSNISITDSDLGQTPNWTGAEVVIRKNDWSLDRCRITRHSGGTLYYTSLGTTQEALSNHGYFIQNDLRTLSQFGEWYHDVSSCQIYIYLGTTDPLRLNIEIATLKNLVHNAGKDFITLEQLHFRGSIDNMIEFINPANDNIIIRNCQFAFAGQDCINLWGNRGNINNNIISYCNQTAIQIIGNQHNVLFNLIENVGLTTGQAFCGSQTIGIIVNDNECLVKNNIIRNVGYSGIKTSSTAKITTIQNNFIHDVLLGLNDGGGIYTAKEGTSRKIDGNIILRVIGNTDGTPYPGRYIARGIYLDVNSTNSIIINNTVAHCNEAGYMIHRAQNNRIENNTAFNNVYGMYFQNSSGSSIRSNLLNHNLFIAKAPTQLTLKFYSVADDINMFGSADKNYYARPADDDNSIQTYSPSTGNKKRTLPEWTTLTNQDHNSKKSAVIVNDTSKISFYYNASNTNKVINLEQPMVDVTGKKFNGSLILFPYTSVVLMPDPEPTKPTAHPDHQDQSLVISITSPTKNNSYTAPATLIVEVLVNDPDNSVHSITLYNGNILLGESSFSPFLFTLKDLEEGNYTLYAVANYKSKASETSTPLKFLVSSSIEKKDSQLKVYPNPNNGRFYFDYLGSVPNEQYKITIINLSGKTVYDDIFSGDLNSTLFDLSYLKPGTYIAIIKNKLIVTTQKFIKT